jgi:hypothetical protein
MYMGKLKYEHKVELILDTVFKNEDNIYSWLSNVVDYNNGAWAQDSNWATCGADAAAAVAAGKVTFSFEDPRHATMFTLLFAGK